ncbi:hypothetical protein NEOLEDRAFT_929332 [Neolentinus lepideus HHB14362 ss-1]|uniref:Fungal-type protein kinase domain-containing protein n=1 Tax=Neolentinus lepideus HHB14362 ss-1 TaxID=1314782 RepID=A0A165NL05_9AGAM|nr:hypothetical protein NEOLEDRAFT_929332 [Neolentinus lepideus HHB14362 ss-1]
MDKQHGNSSSGGSDVTNTETRRNSCVKESDVCFALLKYMRYLCPDTAPFAETGNTGLTRHLINWDLCSDRNLLEEGTRLPSRTGTWQFTSCNLLGRPTARYSPSLQDDFEYFFWVLLYTYLCFIPSSLSTSGNLSQVLKEVFDRSRWREVIRCWRGGDGKTMVINYCRYILPNRTVVPAITFAPAPLNSLVFDLRSIFHHWAQYHKLSFEFEITIRDVLKPRVDLLKMF